MQGAEQVKRLHPDALVVFVRPPSRAEQERRLRRRGEPDDVVARRLADAAGEEVFGARIADQVVVNDDLDRTVAEVAAAIATARHETTRS